MSKKKKKICTRVRRRRLTLSNKWFPQDGAIPHTATKTRNLLSEKFEYIIISLKTPHVWAPYSPYPNPFDFFLWGYAKDNVYRNNPGSILELKNEIEVIIRTITAESVLTHTRQ